jgi:hypothetical protein
MNRGYKVEKGIPLPKHKGMGCPRKYPFATMQPGDSFAVTGKKEFLRARAAASVHKKSFPGWFYAARATDTGGRIWRILPDAHFLLAGGPANATSPGATSPDNSRGGGASESATLDQPQISQSGIVSLTTAKKSTDGLLAQQTRRLPSRA